VLGTKPGALHGEIEALNLVTGKVEWDTKVKGLPVGAATVANNVVLTTLFQGELLALNATTGKVVLKKGLPNTTNSTIAVAGDMVLVPAGGPKYKKGGVSQVDAYTVGSAAAG
jgi:outer membrane protein assembly factor BamB